MADEKKERGLKLLDAFDIAATDIEKGIMDQVGYEKIDDTTVLERKVIPLVTSSKASDQVVVRVDVYDFNAYTVTSYTVRAGHSDVAPMVTSNRDFSQVEGKQSIRDAHRALVALEGSPPQLDEIMDFGVELKKSLTAATPIKLKPGQPQ